MRVAFLALWVVLLAAPAAAGDPCAKFADALAYNACLARQGPASQVVHVGKAPAAHRAHGQIATAPRRGRASMVFSVGK